MVDGSFTRFPTIITGKGEQGALFFSGKKFLNVEW